MSQRNRHAQRHGGVKEIMLLFGERGTCQQGWWEVMRDVEDRAGKNRLEIFFPLWAEKYGEVKRSDMIRFER